MHIVSYLHPQSPPPLLRVVGVHAGAVDDVVEDVVVVDVVVEDVVVASTVSNEGRYQIA